MGDDLGDPKPLTTAEDTASVSALERGLTLETVTVALWIGVAFVYGYTAGKGWHDGSVPEMAAWYMVAGLLIGAAMACTMLLATRGEDDD